MVGRDSDAANRQEIRSPRGVYTVTLGRPPWLAKLVSRLLEAIGWISHA